MEEIRSMLGGDNEVAREIESLWLEYEDQVTPESRFVKDLDKLEMIIQVSLLTLRIRGKVVSYGFINVCGWIFHLIF